MFILRWLICCPKVSLGGKNCSKLLAAQKVTQNSKSCQKSCRAQSIYRYIGLTDTRVEDLRVLQALRCTPVYFAEPVSVLIHARLL